MLITEKGVQTMIEEFVCPICVQLVEAPVITTCSHVFCKPCWEEWMSQSKSLSSSKCPKCNRVFTGLGASADNTPPVAELKIGNPLAHRILNRVQVRCMLPECSWTGDYSEISAHLTASDSHHTRARGGEQAAKQDAEVLKEQGNARFSARSFHEALKLYNKAIALDGSQPSYYANRAAAWLMLGAPKEALQDCEAALALDPKHVRSHIRLAKALLDLGQIPEALAHLSNAAQLVQESHELAQEFARVGLISSTYTAAVSAYEGREAGRAMWGNVEGMLLPESMPKQPKIEKNYPRALELFEEVERSVPCVALQVMIPKP